MSKPKRARTPIYIVTGYLGSGKTTFLRRIISSTDRRLAILMNEFGELSIDGRVIQGKNVNMVELLGGCVCCSLTGEFEAAVKEIVEKVNPELIVVETTGVAEPDSLLANIQENIPEVRLDLVITLVDAYSMVKFPSLGHTGRIQIEMGDLIIINKVDLVTEEELKEVEKKVREINEKGIIFKTSYANVDLRILFGLEVDKAHQRPGLAHVGEEPVESLIYTSNNPIDLEKFEAFLEGLPEDVYRGKGFLVTPQGRYHFNYVAGRLDLEEFDAEKNEAIFIGKRLATHREEILKRLKECEVAA